MEARSKSRKKREEVRVKEKLGGLWGGEDVSSAVGGVVRSVAGRGGC